MQATLRADSVDRAVCAQAPSSASRLNRFMAAGVAVVGATAIAATPVTPSMPIAHDIEQRAVALAANANPLDDLGALFQNTLTNVGTLGGSILTTSIPSVAQAITNPAIYADFVKFLGTNVLNPLPLLQHVIGFPGTYGGVIGAGLQAGSVALQDRLSQLPTVLTNTLQFLSTGQFVEAFSEVNVWFLVSIERALVPLLPVLSIPGDFVGSLPNGERLAAVFDTLLKRGVFTEFTRSLLGPAASAGLQFSLVLDDIRNAVVTGDLVSAASHIVSLPIKVVNALVNGFVPPFTSRSPWTGILGDRGTLDYFFVDLPKALADAFNNPVFPVPAPPVVAPPATTAALVSDVTSTDLALSGDIVALPASNVEKAAPAAEVEETAPVTEVEETAPVTEVEETAPVTEVEETAPATEVETPADETAAGTDTDTTGDGTSTDTKSDDTKSDDTKSDDTKSDDTKSDTKTDSKTDSKTDTKSDAKTDSKTDTKSDDSKSGATKSGATKTGASKPGQTKSGASASAGSTSGGSDSGSSDSGSSD